MPDWSGRIWLVSTRGVVITVDPASGDGAAATWASRSATRSRSTRPAACTSSPTTRCTGWTPRPTARRRHLARALREHRREEARPDRDGLGHHAHPDGPRLRGDHRQRRPDERGGLQAGQARARTRESCAQPVFAQGRQRHRQLADRHRARRWWWRTTTATAGRRPSRAAPRRPGWQRVDIEPATRAAASAWNSGETRSVGRAQALARERAGLHLHQGRRRRTARGPVVPDRARLPHRARRPSSGWRATGLGFNNNYAPVSLGPDGTAYVGVLGGLVALRDRTAPPRVQRPAGPRPRLRLAVRGLRRVRGSRRRCARRGVRIRIRGSDSGLIVRSRFRARGFKLRRARRDARSPFTLTLSRRALRPGHRYRVRASARLYDQRLRRLSTSFRRCR